MSYMARVFKVFIASPSDDSAEREVVKKALEEWNVLNSEREKMMFLPSGWDISGAPQMGKPAQDYINADILDNCDILIGIIWKSLGSPTKNSISGTVEEIKRQLSSKKLTVI